MKIWKHPKFVVYVFAFLALFFAVWAIELSIKTVHKGGSYIWDSESERIINNYSGTTAMIKFRITYKFKADKVVTRHFKNSLGEESDKIGVFLGGKEFAYIQYYDYRENVTIISNSQIMINGDVYTNEGVQKARVGAIVLTCLCVVLAISRNYAINKQRKAVKNITN